ncbi:MAG: EpsI family protein [Deltaproteobacteria bacterium]|nr:EpsI family protein [Deltaproteobacteria bacterium]
MAQGRIGTALLCTLLVGIGALAWWLQLQPPLRVDASALATLPREIGAWTSQDVPLESAVEAELRADMNLQRLYVHPTGAGVWLYIGYYGTARGGRPEHTPRGCYTGAGWGIESTRSLDADPGGSLRVNEYVVERDGERQLVHFWYRSHRRTGLLGGLDQNVDRLLGRLLDGRADGALVRLSTPLGAEDEVAARGRLLGFAAELDPMLAARWPEETSSPPDGPRVALP